MIYKSKEGAIDLSKVIRLYPAVVIDMQGEVAEMSLEWFDLYGDQVKFLHFVLVFDSTKPGDEERTAVSLRFDTKADLIEEMQKVSQLFQ
ncbi:MAG: hypothetical protein FAF05_03600 [Epsilonproteobacteria bacterium]|nr:hypothetical protein [Campylobacterota bacterium]